MHQDSSCLINDDDDDSWSGCCCCLIFLPFLPPPLPPKTIFTTLYKRCSHDLTTIFYSNEGQTSFTTACSHFSIRHPKNRIIKQISGLTLSPFAVKDWRLRFWKVFFCESQNFHILSLPSLFLINFVLLISDLYIFLLLMFYSIKNPTLGRMWNLEPK